MQDHQCSGSHNKNKRNSSSSCSAVADTRTVVDPQPSRRRSDPVTRRHPDDAGDRRGGKAAWHSRARPQHRRQGRAREPQRAAVDLTRAFSTRGQVVHRSLLNRRHDQHVRENAPVERERASGSGRREPAGKVDFDVVKIQKLMIERIGRLVDRLLDGEEKLCPQRVVSNRTALPRRGDQLEHVRR